MSKSRPRQVVFRAATSKYRVDYLDGVLHYVVPVVALVEGVVWPVTAKQPELVLAEEFQTLFSTWNGKPVFCGHPMVDDEIVLGSDPEIYPWRIGLIFNTSVDDLRLLMEAWVDPERCVSEAAKELLSRIQRGEPLEISTGLLALQERVTGFYGPKKYFAIWRRIGPDHLALLPAGEEGACSLEMGCGGLRASASAKVHTITAEGIKESFMADTKRKKNRTAEEKKKLMTAVRALQTPQQGAAEEAAELVAYQTMETLLKQAQQTTADALSKVTEMIADETENPTMTSSEEEAEEIVEVARLEALYALAGASIDTLYKILSLCNSCLMAEYGDEYPRYAKGARHSKIDQKMLQTVHDNAVSLGAACETMAAAAGHKCAKCSSKQTLSQEEIMNKEQRIAALMSNEHSPLKDKAAFETLSDVALGQIEAAAAAAKKAADDLKVAKDATVAAQGEVTTLRAAAATPKVPTEAEFLASHPQINDIVVKHNATVTARKTEIVGKLKAAQTAYSEAELNAMAVDQLEKLALLAKIDVAPTTVDFSGLSMGRPTPQPEGGAPPAPPSLVDAIKANQGQQQKSA